MKPKKLLLPSIGEGALILVVGAVGWAAHMPLIFTSLGPTAYELVEKPKAASAKTYNILVGHFVALAAGFFALWVLAAWNAPKVGAAGFVASPRVWAAVLATVVTTAVTLLLKASQPAALSTTLLVSLGSMQRGRDAIAIVLGVIILAAVGEPVRRQFEKLSAENRT
ncbi:MAG: HPP family protein [Terriglobales bacterium]